MRIAASAPGKLVLAGEYAVLEGSPALVMAVDRRACVALDDGDDDTYCIDAPDLDINAARCRLRDGRVHWSDMGGADADRLRLVSGVLEALASDGAPAPFRAELDTHAFFATGNDRGKLGLGSSAALTAALTAAISTHDGRGTPSLAELLAAHRRQQHGRGSGLDVAAALTGGLLVYRLHDDKPAVAAVPWPSDLAWCCVWSGRAASTDAALARLAWWRRGARAEYDSLMHEIGICAASAVAAVRADHAAGLLQAIAACATALQRLGQASGIDIVCAEHRAIAALAAACGVTYKTCGAGGGDVGIALDTDPQRMQRFRLRLVQGGFRELDLGLDRHGLRVQAHTSCNRSESWTTCA